ncbi:addiction module antidote protein, HigA family, partial [Acinetobacter baumannii]|nr:addiction module antidote protein, HigA family [Acinetobacter baumannii]
MTAAARHPNGVLTQWHEAGGVLTIELARQLGVPANGT